MSYGGQCAFCDGTVQAEHAAYKVAGYELTRDQGGQNVVHDKERVLGWIAHQSCFKEWLRKKQRGINENQEVLV